MKRYNIYCGGKVIATTTDRDKAMFFCGDNNGSLIKSGINSIALCAHPLYCNFKRVSVMVIMPISVLDGDKAYKDAERTVRFDLTKG